MHVLYHQASGLRRAAVVVICMVVAGCVSVNRFKPEQTVDGLQRMESQRVDTVYTAPDMTLAPYKRIMLDPINVAFKKDWQRSHPELSPGDIERIRSDAAKMFREVFARELQDEGGYALADQSAPDVLQVTASIVDLEITAPDVKGAGSSSTYVVSPGEMTLLAELRDSVTGAILVRVADRKRGREFGLLQISDTVTNSAEAQRAFALWAKLLRDALDAADEPEPAS